MYGGHEDWSHPTTLVHEYRHRNNRGSGACIVADYQEGDKDQINGCYTSRSATAGCISLPTKSPLEKKI